MEIVTINNFPFAFATVCNLFIHFFFCWFFYPLPYVLMEFLVGRFFLTYPSFFSGKKKEEEDITLYIMKKINSKIEF